MTARTFGRKGIIGGAVAAPSRRAALVAPEPPDIDEAALRRAAFLAEERAHAEPTPETLAFEVTPAAVSEAVWGKPKSLAIAYALWLVLGIFGAHRFYLERYISATLQAALGAASWALLAAEYYPAFVGMAVALLWMSADAYFVRAMHARPPRAGA
jgi:TM2 domain-containing membrane protein YozV